MSEVINLNTKLAQARVELQKKLIKKSGKNDFAKYKYFNLEDFIPSINEIFLKLGIGYNSGFTKMKFSENEELTQSETWYRLALYNLDDEKDILISEMPIADAGVKGSTAMQQLGAVETYCRRYRFMAVLGISESDKLEPQTDEPAEPSQLQKLKELYTEEEINKSMKRWKIEKLEDITWQQAERAIIKRRGKTTDIFKEETF